MSPVFGLRAAGVKRWGVAGVHEENLVAFIEKGREH